MADDLFYHKQEWYRVRTKVIRASVFCYLCKKKLDKTGKNRIHVDHIKPRKKFPELSLDMKNLRACCNTCHNSVKQRLEKGKRVPEYDADGWPVE